MTALTPLPLGGGIFLDPFAAIREFEKMFSLTTQPSYPPYNLIKKSDTELVLEFAVAGFSKEDINISVENRHLVIRGEQEVKNEENHYLHRGIGMRKFTRTFQLPEHVEVGEATMENGILRVAMTQIVPEEKKPKQITIK